MANNLRSGNVKFAGVHRGSNVAIILQEVNWGTLRIYSGNRRVTQTVGANAS